eukprot:7329226-Prymnesium_polylepis.2
MGERRREGAVRRGGRKRWSEGAVGRGGRPPESRAGERAEVAEVRPASRRQLWAGPRAASGRRLPKVWVGAGAPICTSTHDEQRRRGALRRLEAVVLQQLGERAYVEPVLKQAACARERER